MTWWDGFVVALANPGFLIAALGGSIGALGTTGAFVLWTISITLGALQNNIHAELAAMFPAKSGGIALYAHEAWRKYLTIIGPLASFGYWIGWSVVLSINGLVAGTLIQAEWFSDTTWAENVGHLRPHAADRDRHRADHPGLGLQRLRRPAGRLVRLRHRRAAHHPRLRADVPALPHRRVVELEHELADRRQRRPGAGARLALLHVLVVVRDRGGGDLRPRVPGHRARHGQGAAGRGAVLGRRLRAAAARRGRHAGHRRDRGGRHADRVLHAGLRRASSAPAWPT